MLKKIEALRKEPKHVRNRYAFWTAFFVTLVIIVVWGSTLPARFMPGQMQEPSTENNWSDYKNALGSVLNGAFSRFGEITTEKAPEEAPERIDFVELVASSSTRTATGSGTQASTTLGTTTPDIIGTTTASTTATSTEIRD